MAEGLTIDLFDYPLPAERIAQEPAEPRDAARLLVLDRTSGARHDAVVTDLPALLRPGDCLVVNDTRVLPARLLGHVAGTGRPAEILLLRALAGSEWEVLLRPGRRCRPGTAVVLADGAARAVVTGEGARGRRRVRLEWPGSVRELLSRYGLPPLPPYIRRYRKPGGEDWTRYQTVYAEHDGAVAAPTAGLHLTHALLGRLSAAGVELHRVTLHVGPGTFQPVRVARVAEHRMEPEWYEVRAATADALNRARQAGRRIVAVGTTTVRTLEAAVGPDRHVRAGAGWADLTITPGYAFRAVGALLTNFHLPRSSLLLLVAALAGRERILDAYHHAVAAGYRFYSYGDAMLIL